MTKEIANFPRQSCAYLLEVLHALGWEFQNPIDSKITGWSNLGEEVALESSEHARRLLEASVGHGVQLWKAPCLDLFLSCNECARIHFGGFTTEESSALQAALRGHGLTFEMSWDY